MKPLFKWLSAVAVGLAFVSAAQAQRQPQEGTDYQVLKSPVATEEKDRVEVTEFFWYACPHCNQFEPYLEAWVKKLPKDVTFKRVHVRFAPNFIPQQKLYAALEQMGKLEELHVKVFNAIHVEKQRLETDDQVIAWAEKNGLDKKKFMEAYQSFAVQTKSNRYAKLQQDYRIDGVPMIAVDGRFLTSPSMHRNNWAQALQTTEYLIDLARQQKKKGGKS
jgi:thiol:disulfide interchange protein DsbA